MTTIGIIGAGNIGGALARAAIGQGYAVVIANSRGPETLADLVAELGPHARAATAAEAAAAAEAFAVVTVPLRAYLDVPVQQLAGKIVVDTNNYYPERDGQIAELDAKTATSSGLLQRHLPASKVVKAFNHIGARRIGSEGLPAGAPDRQALTVAGDDEDAVRTIAAFVDAIGFDPVRLSLDESWRIETGTPGYGVPLTADELREAHATAQR